MSLVANSDHLRLHHYTGGDWVEVLGLAIDDDLFHLTATGIDSFSLFAVTVIPEPRAYALLAGLLVLGLAAWRRRRR